MKIILTVAFLFGIAAQVVFAGPAQLKSCSAFSRPIRVGTACVLKSNHPWLRVQQGTFLGWKDLTTGDIIFDKIGRDLTQIEGKKACRSRGQQTLPTLQQMYKFDEHGFLELVRIDDDTFWTKTLCQGDATCARSYVVFGYNAAGQMHFRNAKFSILCVADSDTPPTSPQEPDCIEEGQDLRVGQTCVTSAGKSWQRVQSASGSLGWKNLYTKIILFDAVKTGVNQEQAISWCLIQNQRLPTKEHIVDILFDQGVTELFSNMRGYNFWTSSGHKENPNLFGVVYGDGGVWGGMFPKSSSGADTAARCMVQE